MRRLGLALTLALPGPLFAAPAEAPKLSLEQAMRVRCSAAFAIVAGDQARGVEAAKAWPPLGDRGREFFVRASAGLMDDLGLTREQVQALIEAEVARLQDDAVRSDDPAGHFDDVMQPCLLALDASGL
jgi:hypothetical protein